MEDSILVDAVERFADGSMSEQERIYFVDLRKNNPELDQAVVEHLFFLNELNNFRDTRNFKHCLTEVEQKLADEGFVFRKPFSGRAKVVQLWSKYKRTVAVAASIACVVSLFIASIDVYKRQDAYIAVSLATENTTRREEYVCGFQHLVT